METSFYQHIKLQLLPIVGMSKDAIHIYIGLFAFFLWIIATRKPIKSFKSLIPVLVVALLMEALDSKDDYNSFGYIRWKESIHDILNTSIWPFVIVIILKLGFIKTDNY